ncbi:MAG: hypothetical protein WAK60_11335 [Sedimentisphaerales bacterium]
MKIVPNYLLGVFKIILLMVLVTGIFEYLTTGIWWPLEGWFSILAIFFVVPIAICLMSVPQYIVVDKEGFSIRFFLRKRRYIFFKDIHAYCSTRGVFLIQPNIGSTLQIFPGCFSRKKWKTFVGLIKNECPGKKAWFWIGPWAIR